jgi:hypothetical protein
MFHYPELAEKLTAHDFHSDDLVMVDFEDNSRCDFKHAFFRREGKYVVVYTEHCGYHSFYDNSITFLFGMDKTNYVAPPENEEILRAAQEQRNNREPMG